MADEDPNQTPPDEPEAGLPEPLEPEGGVVLEVPIEDEMRRSYIDYSMSVIVGRALPDARDGLKPVHRRILYAMNEMNMSSSRPTRKSAGVVGEVLGKYHPHGDTAIYDSLVRMAQEFSLRYPLVEGQGNFGSIDGDNAAAMRYTECRLTPLAEEVLADIKLDTVDFIGNFDASMDEPVVLPSKIPNLVLNGSAGIAVGMATNMAPHQLGEVVDALAMLIEEPDVDIPQLMSVMPGPDFPTGGIIQGVAGIQQAYLTGRGIVRIRAQVEQAEVRGKPVLLVTEIPYQVNKSKLLKDIASLVREKRLEGIGDLRDESSQEGIRVIIELKRGANPDIVKNQLFQMTQLQTSFGINNLALVNNQPRVLNLKQMLQVFIDHRIEVIVRRTEHLLAKARDREHIVEGLIKALENIDRVIEIIRGSPDSEAARTGLMSELALSEEQARAILDMRLARLTQLEAQKLEEELAQLKKDIAGYETILASEEEQRRLIKEELLELKDKYNDERRTVIVHDEGDLLVEDLIPDEPCVIMLTNGGYVKRVPLEAYRTQGRGGRGVRGISTKEEDHVVDLFVTSNHTRILFITQYGVVYAMKAYVIPEQDRYARGVPVVSLLERVDPGTQVQAALPVKEFSEDQYLFFATRAGKVKKTSLSEYERINVNGKIAVRLEEGDELVNVGITDGTNDIILVKNSGKGVRFHEEQVRPMGRVAAGVKGTELRGKEEVVSMVIISDPEAYLLTITANGKGKRTPFTSFNPKNRGVWGVYMHDCTEATGEVVGAIEVGEEHQILLTSKKGVVIRQRAEQISIISSGQAQGVYVQRLDDEDMVVAIARLALEEGEDELVADEEDEGDPSGATSSDEA